MKTGDIERIGFLIAGIVSLLSIIAGGSLPNHMKIAGVFGGWLMFWMNLRIYSLLVPFVIRKKRSMVLIVPFFFLKYGLIYLYLHIMLSTFRLPPLPFMMGCLVFFAAILFQAGSSNLRAVVKKGR